MFSSRLPLAVSALDRSTVELAEFGAEMQIQQTMLTTSQQIMAQAATSVLKAAGSGNATALSLLKAHAAGRKKPVMATLGMAATVLEPGESAQFAMRLNPVARALLTAEKKPVKLTTTVSVATGGGKPAVKKLAMQVRVPKKKAKK